MSPRKHWDASMILSEDGTPIQVWLVEPLMDKQSPFMAFYDKDRKGGGVWVICEDRMSDGPVGVYETRTMLDALAWMIRQHPTWYTTPLPVVIKLR